MSHRVFIVDDAAFIRQALIQICEQAGLIVVGETDSGEKILDILENANPDLILMDLVLPEQNGIECTRQILEKFPNFKVIACSSISDEFMREKAKAVGCVDFIAKPFRKDEVIEKLNLFFRSQNERRESHG